MTDETLKAEPTLTDVMQELIKINKRLEAQDIQFEAIRQGIIDNAIRFDRLESQIYSVRSDISTLKADLKETRRELV